MALTFGVNMDHYLLFYLVLLLFCSLVVCDSPMETVHRRFEYKFSFKGPHLVQKDNNIPFWEYGGSAMASPEQIRITPSLRSKKGYVWTKVPTEFEYWELEIPFRVTGRGRIGADGLALWYTEKRGTEGSVFGSNDQWNGLGVFFDSFDNDGLQNNPYIMAVQNDGTKSFNHQSDGRDQQIAGCLKDFRNKPYPVKAKLEYYKNVLTLSISNGQTKEDNYEICVRAENILLPKKGYFGMSAATGGLADDHDVLAFNTYSLTDPKDKASKVAEEEEAKYKKEYDDYQRKLEADKKKFREEHPDAGDGLDEDPSKWYESPQARELRQIFDGQNDIQHTIRVLNKKIDEMMVRQEQTLNQVIAVGNRGGGAGTGGGLTPQHIQSITDMGSSLSQVNSILNDLKNDVNNQFKKGGYGIQELKEFMRGQLEQSKPQPCPTLTMPDCVSSKSLMIMLMLQAVIVIGYLIYKSNKEAQAKKFY